MLSIKLGEKIHWYKIDYMLKLKILKNDFGLKNNLMTLFFNKPQKIF